MCLPIFAFMMMLNSHIDSLEQVWFHKNYILFETNTSEYYRWNYSYQFYSKNILVFVFCPNQDPNI